MPYAANVYSVPPGTLGTTLTPIDSSDYNAFVLDVEAAQNAARPVVAGGTGAQTVIGAWDALAKKGTDIATASSVNLTTATGPSLSLTGTTTITAVTLAEGSIRVVRAAGAFQITASASLLCNGSASVNMSVAAEDLLIFRGGASSVVTVTKLGTAFASNANALAGSSSSLAVTPANLAQERTLAAMSVGMVNGTLVTSTNTGARTVAIKTLAGNDPSASDPVYVAFRDSSAATAGYSVLTLTAATSLVITSGATMGFSNAIPGRLWIVGFNDAGTFRLGAVNVLSGTSIMALRDGLYSSTIMSAASDNAQVIYTGTAVTSKAMRILGYIDVTETTAGTWANTPTNMVLRSPGVSLPGEVVQVQRTDDGSTQTGTTVTPLDNTIPQISEGNQFLSQAITPVAAANLLHTNVLANVQNNNGSRIATALFRNSNTDAVATASSWTGANGTSNPNPISYRERAATTSAVTMSVRSGSVAGTTTFNGSFGGTYNSFIEVIEIMA